MYNPTHMTVEHGGSQFDGSKRAGNMRLSVLAPVEGETPIDSQYPLSLDTLNRTIYGKVLPHHKWAIDNVRNIDWSTNHWNMESKVTRKRAGQALAAGIPGFMEFGNFKALLFHPHEESMRTVNVAKGRDKDQVASVVTTRDHIEEIFDWTKLQGGLTKEGVMEMIHSFYDRSDANPHATYAGPFGFRGPAADHIPNHLTSVDPETGLRTVQLIAPAYDCLSNDVVTEAIVAMKKRSPDQPNYLAITSANPSGHKTGKDEPAHYLRRGIQEEFHDYKPGFFIMGHRDEAREATVREQYPNHDPNSTTILDISRAELDENGVTSIHMARHGSLSDERTTAVVISHGMELKIDNKARPNLQLREYSAEFLAAGQDVSEAEAPAYILQPHGVVWSINTKE